jgi:hypothetical protein
MNDHPPIIDQGLTMPREELTKTRTYHSFAKIPISISLLNSSVHNIHRRNDSAKHLYAILETKDQMTAKEKTYIPRGNRFA